MTGRKINNVKYNPSTPCMSQQAMSISNHSFKMLPSIAHSQFMLCIPRNIYQISSRHKHALCKKYILAFNVTLVFVICMIVIAIIFHCLQAYRSEGLVSVLNTGGAMSV